MGGVLVRAVGSGQSAVGATSTADCRLPTADVAATRAKVVTVARSWIGTPYRHQASLKGVGCDCLGLLIGVWREVQTSRSALRLDKDFAIPPYTPDWAEANGRETLAEGLAKYLTEIDPKEAREGDIVLFRWRAHLPAKHCGDPDRARPDGARAGRGEGERGGGERVVAEEGRPCVHYTF